MNKNLECKFVGFCKRFEDNPEDLAVQDAIPNVGRQLIEEKAWEVWGNGQANFNTTTREIKGRSKSSEHWPVLWSEINDQLHHGRIKDETRVTIEKINALFQFITGKTIYELKYQKATKTIEIAWQKMKSESGYHALIVSKRNNELDEIVCEIAHTPRGYGQKNKKIIHAKRGTLLFEGANYLLNWDVEQSDYLGEKITRNFLTNHKLIFCQPDNQESEITNWIKKIIEKYKVTPKVLLSQAQWCVEYDYERKKLIEIFKEIWKSKSNYNLIITNAISLFVLDKKSSEKILENPSPLYYEFWTKESREIAIGYSNKKLIFLLLKEIDSNFEKRIFGEFHLIFENELKRQRKYFIHEDELKKAPIFESHPNIIERCMSENDLFKWGYEQSKIVEPDIDDKYENQWTIKKYRDLLSYCHNFLEYFELLKSEKSQIIDEDLDEYQLKIANDVFSQSKSIIIGDAGTGKTKLIGALIKELINQNKKYVYLAPTHKARVVVEEFMDGKEIESNTIQKIVLNKELIEKYDNFIIDEISMLEDEHWQVVFQELKSKDRVILVGDEKQIPALHSTGFVKNLLECSNPKLIKKLSKNYRQNGKLKKFIEDFRSCPDLIKYDSNYVSTYQDAIDLHKKVKSKELKEFKILTPLNFGFFGRIFFNSIISGDKFKEGDEVIIDETDDQEKWRKILYQNRILKIEKVNNTIFTFSDKFKQSQIIDKENKGWFFKDAKLCYRKEIDDSQTESLPFKKTNAITVHSAQGSTFNKVIFVIPPGYSLDKKMFYTAISRAKEDLKIFVYDQDYKNHFKS